MLREVVTPDELHGVGGGGGIGNLFAGTNITISTSGNSATIIGNTNSGATTFLAGISTQGGTSGTTGFVNNQMQFVGGNNVTLSQSVNAQSATLTISAGNGIETMGMSNLGNTSGTTGVVSGSAIRFLFAGGNNITLSQSINGSTGTITISAASQTLQTSNLFDLTLSGNTSGALALVSSGTLTLAGGNNITLSQAGNAITISGGAGGAFTAGVSTQGNTLGTTGTVNNGVVFVGGNNITLSQSSAAGGATVTISGPNAGGAQTGISGIAGSAASTVTNGTVQFANANGVSFGLNGSTMTASVAPGAPQITLSGNTSGVLAIISSGTLTLAGGNNITLSQNGNAVTISAPSGGGIGVSTGGNTSGTTGTVDFQMIFAGGNNITLSQSINGSSATITISAGASQTVESQTLGMSNLGNTSGTTGVASGAQMKFIFVGSNNITLSQSLNGASGTITFLGVTTASLIPGDVISSVTSANISGTQNSFFARADHQHAGVGPAGVSTGGNTSGNTTVAHGQLVFVGGNNVTLSQGSDASNRMTITISGPTGGGAGMSNIGNTAGTSGTVGAQLVFVGTNDISLSQSTAAGGSGTLTIFGPGVRSKFHWIPEGAVTSGQQVNTNATVQMVQVPYPISFSRVDIPFLLSLSSSATTNTGNILISSGLVIHSISNASTLNPIAGAFGTTTYTWASNTSNFNNLTGARFASFPIATSLSAGIYFVYVNLSTTNNSSIGLSTTQYANTISMLLGSLYTASAFAEFGSTVNATTDLMPGMGQCASATATNATIGLANINMVSGSKSGANVHVIFRNF